MLTDNRWQIFTLELSKAWNGYIGLPIKDPKEWKIVRPNLDEL